MVWLHAKRVAVDTHRRWRISRRLFAFQYGLPLIALALLTAVLAWPQRNAWRLEIADDFFVDAKRLETDKRLTSTAKGVVLKGVSKDGTAYSIYAELAESRREESEVKGGDGEETLDLTSLELIWHARHEFRVLAARGRHDTKAGESRLTEGVVVKSSRDALRIEGPDARFDWDSNLIEMTGPVSGASTRGRFTSQAGLQIELTKHKSGVSERDRSTSQAGLQVEDLGEQVVRVVLFGPTRIVLEDMTNTTDATDTTDTTNTEGDDQ